MNLLYGFVNNNPVFNYDYLGLEIQGPFIRGNYVYFHVYEDAWFGGWLGLPDYLGTVKLRYHKNSVVPDRDADIATARRVAKQIEIKSGLGKISKVVQASGTCAEITIRIVNEPLDTVAFAAEFIEKPTWINAASMLPFIPGGLKKVKKLWKIKRYTKIVMWKKGKLYYDPKYNYWWSKDIDKHGGSVWKVYEDKGKYLEWVADADKYGQFMKNKHKGSVGKKIPKKELKLKTGK